MKLLISKTCIILALTSPVALLNASSIGFDANNETVIHQSRIMNSGMNEISRSSNYYENTEAAIDTATTETGRKGWDGTVKGNSKGITQSGIKRTEAQRKGWDGTVKGSNIQESSINETDNPAESMQQKTTINTTRSNIKRGTKNPNDDLQQNDAAGTSNPYYQNNANAGDMPAQLQRGIDKKNVVKGTPIGGIIVKGGKNPGGQMFTVVTNDKGQVEINNLEVGNYTLTLTSPASGLPSGSVSKAPGGPIGGIVVKGGKNPGGQMFTVITNDKGQADIDISEAGNYIIKVKLSRY